MIATSNQENKTICDYSNDNGSRVDSDDYIKMNRGINDSKDLPREYLEGIYSQIKEKGISLKDERNTVSKQNANSIIKGYYKHKIQFRPRVGKLELLVGQISVLKIFCGTQTFLLFILKSRISSVSFGSTCSGPLVADPRLNVNTNY